MNKTIITSYDQESNVLTIRYDMECEFIPIDIQYLQPYAESTMHFTYHKYCYWAIAIRISNPFNWKMQNAYTTDSIMDMGWNFPVSQDLLAAFKFWLLKTKVFE